MRRFFINPVEPDCHQALLDREESHHLVRVLRLSPGELIELFDGQGMCYSGRVEKLGRRVSVTLLSGQQVEAEKCGSVILCQGELKGGKMDLLVEKCTELGVEEFIPFTAGRSQGRVDEERLKRRRQRRQSIVKTACKQCGRPRFMNVGLERGFDDMIDIELEPLCRKIILWEHTDEVSLTEAIGGDRRNPVCLMVGPEGGFSDQEVARAASCGWQPVSLGGLILRAETAAISAVAVTNNLLGRM